MAIRRLRHRPRESPLPTDLAGKTRIAILDDYQDVASGLADWASLGPSVETIAFHDHVGDPCRLAARLADFDVAVLMRERTPFDAATLGQLPNLKLLATFGMANAAIDLAVARARGVVVCGTEPNHPNGTPALTWALILAAMRDLPAQVASVRAGGWQLGLGRDTAGAVLGVLGLGKIGQVVAKVGLAFGMRVIAWSQNLTDDTAAAHGVTRVDKDALFAEADVLTLHLRLSARTRHIVGARELALMKPSALLVNTSRGPLVDEAALVLALQANAIGGAALDVYDAEPLPATHPFRFLPNVVATPHIGYVTRHTYADAYPQIVENIRAWRAGAPLRVLNP